MGRTLSLRARTLLFASLLSLLGSEAAAYAQSADQAPSATAPGPAAGPNIAVRAGTHPGFDRIVFDWPRDVNYKLNVTDGRASIAFAASGRARFNAGMFQDVTRASGFSATTDSDGHLLVSFAVNPGATLKDFTSDHSVVIDIQGGPAPRQAMLLPTAAPPPSPPPPIPAVIPPQTLPTTAPATPPVKTAAVPVTPSASPTPTAPTPAAQTTRPTLAPTTAPIPLVAAKPPLPKEVVKEPPPLNATPTQIAATPPLKEGPVLPLANPANSAPAPLAAPLKTVEARPVPDIKTAGSKTEAKPLNLTDTPMLVVSMDPHTPVRAVIYERAGYVYIVFDRKFTLDQTALVTGQPAPLINLEPLDLPKVSGFRFPVTPGTSVTGTREGTVWQIFLSKQQPDIPVSANLIAQPDFALGARYLLPLADSPDPVAFTDPVVGDDLILIPMQQTEAFSIARRMADFQILPAAQGLVLHPLTDKLTVRAVTDGIEITGEGGLHLSSATDTGASTESPQKAKAAATGKSIFSFNAWRGHPGETFTQTRQRLQQTIVDVPEAERNRARLELARFYFAHGYGEEAVGLLNLLLQNVPDLKAHADFIALLGAAQITAYHADEGLQTLQNPLLDNQPEISLWRAVAHADLRDWQTAATEFSPVLGLLDGYPDPFYSRFAILSVESALAVGNDHQAANLLDKIEASAHNDSIDPAILYLRGVLDAKSGRALAAEAAWKDVAASRDRLYKIRAELALIDLGVSTKSLTPSQAADRLEALRFGWRGDDLEIDILHRLGEFYVQAGNMRAGINTLGQAIQLYPDSPLVPGIRAEMQQIFHDVYLSSAGKNLSPLDSLALYQQFSDLMPSGKEGETVTRNLAERLVAVDLLDQAAALLQDLVKNHLQGEDKARTGARLAAIRLLDHKPDDALTALSYSDKDTLPQDLQNERQLLRARALSEQHHDDEALALLKDRTDQPAKLLRADITMRAQQWAEAAKTLLDLIGPPPAAGHGLTHDQAEWLVRCAIAYALVGDQTSLDRLAIDYGPAMTAMPENDTFRVLTETQKTAQPQDIAAAQSKLAEVDLFQGFLNNYRKHADGDDDNQAPDAKPAAPPAP